MTVQINHAIVAAYDRQASAVFFAEIFSLAEPTEWGPFSTVLLGDGAHLHFAEPPDVTDIQFQHYAFKVDDQQFDEIYTRLQDLKLEHWADPQMQQPSQINTNHGGRGVYFRDAAILAFPGSIDALGSVTFSSISGSSLTFYAR